MIGVDSNVLVRYIVADDEVQAAVATEALQSLSSKVPSAVQPESAGHSSNLWV